MAVTFLTNEDVLIVNITLGSNGDYTSSHSASEIKERLESGSHVVGRLGNADLFLEETNEDYGVSESFVGFVHYAVGDKQHFMYRVKDDKTLSRVAFEHNHDGDYVETVNGIKPDSNGNVEITIPESGGNAGNAVLYTAQTLTEEQKAQARENIGAVTMDEVLAALPVGEGVKY